MSKPMRKSLIATRINSLMFLIGVSILLLFPNNQIFAQGQTTWIRIGELQDWFSELGCEWEVGRRGLVPDQQDGLQWPARYPDQDSKAAKGLWIGAQNYHDFVSGETYPYKVVQVGPRSNDYANEIFPVEFKLIGRSDHPLVTVDGEIATDLDYDDVVDEIDPNLKADRLLITKVRTSMGIDMTRNIYAFSQQYNDNYFIYEFIFKNTGIVDAKGTQNPQTLQGVYFMWQYRYAICKEMGAYGQFFMPQNATWGTNTMNQVIGQNPSAGDPFRALYAWHGLHSGVSWDNIGAPNVDADGRLTASQFVGVVTIHADKSPSDNSDDGFQPTSTPFIDSDDPITQGGFHNQYDPGKMTQQYNFMASGHPPLTHADAVGDGFPNEFLNTAGGFSQAQGFGPYTMEPGDSIRIVMAEAMAGIDWDKTIEVGHNWFNETGDYNLPGGATTSDRDEYKDAWVFTGKDSLFQTFQRAINNWNGGMDISQPPPPPDEFAVESGGDRIQLTWTPNAESWPGFSTYRIYRAIGKRDTTYEQIGSDLPAGTNQYDDENAARGFNYYYYIISYDNTDLESSLFYTRTNLAANLQRQAGSSLKAIRVVPNPYNVRAARTLQLGYGLERIAFLDIPALCTIKIFTERGDLVQTIEHTNGTGDEYWDLVTSSRQTVVSGIYIAYFEVTQDYHDPNTGELLYRRGDNTFRKFAIIR
jgi:hypothetical protein